MSDGLRLRASQASFSARATRARRLSQLSPSCFRSATSAAARAWTSATASRAPGAAEECLAHERLGEVRLVVEPGLPERLVERVQSERLGLGPAARFLVGRFVGGPRPRGPVVIHARIAGPVRTRRPKALDERLPRRGAEPRLAARRREDPAAGFGSSALRTASPI